MALSIGKGVTMWIGMARSSGDGNDRNWFDCTLCIKDDAVDFCGVNGLLIHWGCGIAMGGGAGNQFCSSKWQVCWFLGWQGGCGMVSTHAIG